MKVVSASPHLHSGASTQRIMLDVIIAMLPAMGFSFWAFGLNAVIVTLTSVASCVVLEWAITRFLLKQQSTICDLSAVVTGMLLAFNLPSGISPLIVVVGALVAIGVGKMSFGGIGRNPFNPALVGRVFLLISFPVQMTTYTGLDGVTGATPLAMLKEGGADALPQLFDMMFGMTGGSLGEVSGVLLLLGGLYLIIRKVITWHIPVIVLGTMLVFNEILWFSGVESASTLFHLFAGGAILGAVFMATDYSSSPMTKKGVIVYAIGIGLITMFIREWGAYPEGMSFAILIMNATVPLLNMYLKPKRFGKK
ncbi:MAG: RnfABCDGE type electron transport complex subunit D [Rikenellaceae bacterium]